MNCRECEDRINSLAECYSEFKLRNIKTNEIERTENVCFECMKLFFSKLYTQVILETHCYDCEKEITSEFFVIITLQDKYVKLCSKCLENLTIKFLEKKKKKAES